MSEQTTVTNEVSTEKLEQNIYRSYNYVGRKETIAYLFNDFSNTFNINGSRDRFEWDLVKIDFGIKGIVNIFTGIWDVFNDTFISAIVDNTRTRIGKFRPYLVTFQIPLTILGILFWLTPYFFPNTDGMFVPKLIFYFAFGVVSETAGTFTSVARGGYMSTITPNPNERIRLITLAELLTGYMGEDVPQYVFNALYDLINNDVIHLNKRALFLGFGSVTAIISCAFTLWYFLVSRERVPQSIERPSIRQGLKAIVTNYPVLLMCLSDFLGGFAVGTDRNNYWIDVLGGASFASIASAPSAPVGSISYAFVQPLRRRFSSKFLWTGADFYGDMLTLGYFLFGMVNKNYTKRGPMMIAFGLQEFFTKLLFGVNKVINADLWNEAMDYCEWKNGYRMEATTGVARGLVLKLQGVFMGTVRSFIMKKIGYVQGLKVGTQDDRTKFWLFALSSVVPFITGALGIVPKLLWPISKKKRAQMYYELAERRRSAVDTYMETSGNAAVE